MSLGRKSKKGGFSTRVVVCYVIPIAVVCIYVLGLLYFTSRVPRKHYLADHRIPPVQYDRFLTVIVLTYNNSAILSQQLQMIQSLQRPYSIHVTVADNGCFPATRAVVHQYHNVSTSSLLTWSYLELCNNTPYATANNFAVAASPSSNWLLFLNDDVIPHDEFFTAFARTVKVAEISHADLGAVGCKLIFTDGRLMEAGSIVHGTGKTDNFLRDGNVNDPQTKYSRVVHYCSAACLFVKRNAFNAANGFDDAHYPGYFEDTHLQMHITHRQHLQVIYSPELSATHIEHGTFGSDTAKQMMITSGKTFYNLWNSELFALHPQKSSCDSCHGALSAHLLSRDVRSEYATKIVVMVDAAVLSAVYALLCQLQMSGLYLVTVLLTSSSVSDNIIHMLQAMGVEMLDSSVSLSNLLSERRGFYHMLIVSNRHMLPPYVNKGSGRCSVVQKAVCNPTTTYNILNAPTDHPITLTLQPSLRGSTGLIVSDVIAIDDSCWNSVDGLYYYLSFVNDRFGAVTTSLKYSGKYSSHAASGESSKQMLSLLRAVRGDDHILNRYELKLLKRLYHVVKPHHTIHS